jgi:hypothetical protein
MTAGKQVSPPPTQLPIVPLSVGADYAAGRRERNLGDAWLYAAVTYRREPNLSSDVVPAQGFEPWTIGLKARYDLRRTPPQSSRCIGSSASCLPLAPLAVPARLYKLAIRNNRLSVGTLKGVAMSQPFDVSANADIFSQQSLQRLVPPGLLV